MEFSHFDADGKAFMVDVSAKAETERIAVAEGTIYMNPGTLAKIKEGAMGKGDVLGVARVAGIMATKRTSDLIPMCHPLMLTKSAVDFFCDEEKSCVTAVCTAKLVGKTGVEMEALTGVTAALLTVYDMCKSVDKGMEITEVHLVKKTGGKSGNYERPV